MNLILIYGPPAVGKYTIAKELSKKTGFKLLSNHSVIDFAESVLNKKDNSFWKFCWKIRSDIVDCAIKQNVSGMIMTMAFIGNKNEISSMNKIFKIIQKNKGKIFVVRIDCDFNTLTKRISNTSRKEFGKLTTIKQLKEWFNNYKNKNLFNKKTLHLDSTNSSIKKSVKNILEFINN